MTKNYEVTESFVITMPSGVYVDTSDSGGHALVVRYRSTGFDNQSCEEKLQRAKEMLLDAVTKFAETKSDD